MADNGEDIQFDLLAGTFGDPKGKMRQALQPFFAGQAVRAIGEGISTSVGQTKLGLLVAGFLRFDLIDGDGDPVPKNSVITAARLELFSNGTDTQAMTLQLAALQKDGRWDPHTQTIPVMQPSNDLIVTVDDIGVGSTGTFIDTGGAGTINFMQTKFSIASSVHFVGQCVSMATGSDETLANCSMVISKVSATTGNVWIEVYAASANDGTDDTASGSILATSDTVDIGTGVGTGASGGVVPFAFSGGDQITLTDGNRYCFMMTTNVSIDGSKWVQAHVTLPPDEYTGGSMVMGDPSPSSTFDFGFGQGMYGGTSTLPHIHDAAGASIVGVNRSADGHPYLAPQGPVLEFAPPTFTANDTWYNFADLKVILQSWVTDDTYDDTLEFAGTPFSSFGLVISTPSGNNNSDERIFDNARIIASYRPRRIRTNIT